MKKIILFVLCGLLALSLFAACAKDTAPAESATKAPEASSEATQAEDSPTSEPVSDYDQAIADRDETVHLVMAALNWEGPMKAQPEVVAAMNEISKEKLNIEFELLFMDIASYAQQLTLMLSGGEQVDLFNSVVIGFTNVINNGFVIDLEEDDLIQKYGPDIIALRGDDLAGTRYEGTLYGTPVHKGDANGLNTFNFGAQYLDAVGFSYEPGAINHVTDEQIEELMAALHEEYPDKAVIAPQTTNMLHTIFMDDIGSDIYGVLLDPVNSLEVSDLFSSEKYADFCNKFYDWNQKGYISGDALTDDAAFSAQMRAGTVLGYKGVAAPGKPQNETVTCGMDIVVMQAGEALMKSSTFTQMPWCISINTVDAIAAMQYLNELYINADLSRLICWGREGYEYAVTEDGHLTFPEGVTSDTTGFLHNVNWEMPNQFIAGVWEGNDLDLWDQMKQLNVNALKSKAMGFSFNNSELTTEYTALANIYAEYKKQLEFGFLDPAVGIPEMVERMEKAGLDKYIAAKQEQIDQWAVSAGVQ